MDGARSADRGRSRWFPRFGARPAGGRRPSGDRRGGRRPRCRRRGKTALSAAGVARRAAPRWRWLRRRLGPRATAGAARRRAHLGPRSCVVPAAAAGLTRARLHPEGPPHARRHRRAAGMTARVAAAAAAAAAAAGAALVAPEPAIAWLAVLDWLAGAALLGGGAAALAASRGSARHAGS